MKWKKGTDGGASAGGGSGRGVGVGGYRKREGVSVLFSSVPQLHRGKLLRERLHFAQRLYERKKRSEEEEEEKKAKANERA